MIKLIAYTCLAFGLVAAFTHVDHAVHVLSWGWALFGLSNAAWFGLVQAGMRANKRRTGDPFRML